MSAHYFQLVLLFKFSHSTAAFGFIAREEKVTGAVD